MNLLTGSEFNHFRGESGKCELVPDATTLSIDTMEEQCDGFTSTWYERTAYRKIPYSSCEGGERPDRGKAHACPGLVGGGGLSGLFWLSIAILPFALAGLAGYWWYHKAGRPGYVYPLIIAGRWADESAIQLGEHRAFSGDGAAGSALSVLASIPVFLVAATQEGWSWVTRRVPFLDDLFTRRSPYRQVPLDDDGEFPPSLIKAVADLSAEVLGNYEDE